MNLLKSVLSIQGHYFIFLAKLCSTSVNLLDKRKLHVIMAWKTVLHVAWYLLSDPREYTNSHSEKK